MFIGAFMTAPSYKFALLPCAICGPLILDLLVNLFKKQGNDAW